MGDPSRQSYMSKQPMKAIFQSIFTVCNKMVSDAAAWASGSVYDDGLDGRRSHFIPGLSHLSAFGSW
jgi:hypothetical protein